jgi:hypothetical protein
MQLLTVDNAKTSKGEKLGYLTGILYLAPAKQAGGRNICPHASPGCLAACLYTAGMGKFSNVQRARIAKTRLFFSDPAAFIETLAADIQALVRKSERLGLSPVVRLNGTSDLPWENLGGQVGASLMSRFPEVVFYDYTKNPARAVANAKGEMPANYFIAFSRSECNADGVARVMRAGGSVAAVFAVKKGAPLPKSWGGRPVVDGDEHDAIFEHGRGVVIGLRAKGDAKGDESGFVIAGKEAVR